MPKPPGIRALASTDGMQSQLTASLVRGAWKEDSILMPPLLVLSAKWCEHCVQGFLDIVTLYCSQWNSAWAKLMVWEVYAGTFRKNGPGKTMCVYMQFTIM